MIASCLVKFPPDWMPEVIQTDSMGHVFHKDETFENPAQYLRLFRIWIPPAKLAGWGSKHVYGKIGGWCVNINLSNYAKIRISFRKGDRPTHDQFVSQANGITCSGLSAIRSSSHILSCAVYVPGPPPHLGQEHMSTAGVPCLYAEIGKSGTGGAAYKSNSEAVCGKENCEPLMKQLLRSSI